MTGEARTRAEHVIAWHEEHKRVLGDYEPASTYWVKIQLARDVLALVAECERLTAERDQEKGHTALALDAQRFVEARCSTLTAALEELLDVAQRIRGGDTKLDPERWYAARDYALVQLAAGSTGEEPTQ